MKSLVKSNLQRQVIRMSSDKGYSYVEFTSRTAAAESVKYGQARAVSKAIYSGCQYLGYMWYNVEDPDISGAFAMQKSDKVPRVQYGSRVRSKRTQDVWLQGIKYVHVQLQL